MINVIISRNIQIIKEKTSVVCGFVFRNLQYCDINLSKIRLEEKGEAMVSWA